MSVSWSTTAENSEGDLEKSSNLGMAQSAVVSLFFMWGFITALNDILIPHLKEIFVLNYFEAMLIQFTFFMAYFLISWPSSLFIERFGHKMGIIVGTAITGIGCLIFYPAASTKLYALFLTGFFTLASGITLLQVAANPYIAILGRSETSSARLNLAQAFNSLGTTLAPYIGAYLILNTSSQFVVESAINRVQSPYLSLAFMLFVISTLFYLLRLPSLHQEKILNLEPSAKLNIFHYPQLYLGIVAIFLYVGAEVSIGSFLVNYLSQPYIMNLDLSDAGRFLSFYWGGAMIGRFIGAISLSRMLPFKVKLFSYTLIFILAVILSFSISHIDHTSNTLIFLSLILINLLFSLLGQGRPGKTVMIFGVLASLFIALSMFNEGSIAMWTILAVGLFNSIMFPTIFSLAISGLGNHSSKASGLLCMAIVGGAIIPPLQGLLADQIGLHYAFILPLLCYLYIAFYGYTNRN